jgi:tetratricopeptide (TPR) repeat protein
LGFSIVEFRFSIQAALLAVGALWLGGCAGKPVAMPFNLVAAGEYGRARTAVAEAMIDQRSNRRYLLDRMRTGVLTLADGHTDSALHVFAETYDVLRTQGINRDKTVASVVINEDLKLWKGEPFEQALAMTYYAMAQAQSGSWDNARAAAGNGLFYLRDFGRDQEGERLDTYAIAQRSLEYERAIDAGLSPEEAKQAGGIDLDHGYVVRPSNFTLGYLLSAIANQQLDRDDEAADHYRRVIELNRELEPVTDALRGGRFNTVLVVSFGFGPRKEGYGPDRALARFTPRSASDGRKLIVERNGEAAASVPVVTDVNHMAADHMWNNLEDVRHGKSVLGNLALYGGTAALIYGIDDENEAAAIAGLGAMAAGAFLKAGAHADTRHCDAFPQRYYLVPVRIDSPDDRVMLQVEGRPGSRLIVTGLPAPRDGRMQLRYLRLPGALPAGTPRPWAVSGQLVVGNPHTGSAGDKPLPYILGGTDAQLPTERSLDAYQAAGHLTGWTLADLREAYRKRSIALSREQQGGYAGLHVLEGGRSMVAPDPGTVGFMRLFAQPPSPLPPPSP